MITTGSDYNALTKRFPLIPIANDKYLSQAVDLLTELGKKDARMTLGERQYFKVLSLLVGAYDEAHHPMARLNKSITHVEIVTFLMETHHLKQVDLAKIIGAPKNRITDILQGKRNFSKAQIARLCAHFHLSADSFIPAAKGTRSIKIMGGKQTRKAS